ALLIHGFPGTPVETRTVGAWLHEAGWSVRAPLLPGFGAQVERLGVEGAESWAAVVFRSLRELSREYGTVLLVGNSMGSALAFAAAAGPCRASVGGVIAFSPFWRVNSRVIDALFPALRRVMPSLRAFGNVGFDEPRVRDALGRILPGADLDDP